MCSSDLVTEATLPRYRELLAHVDAFFPSDDELLLPDAARDPAGALASLASGRLAFVAWKRGAAGGTLYDAHANRTHAWRPHTERVEDPTGAGDAFMAGFVSVQLEREEARGQGTPLDVVERALQRGVVTASFAIEAWGADGLLAASPEAVRARLASWNSEQVRS